MLQYTCKNGVVYSQYRTADTTGFLELGKENPKDDYILYIGGHPEKKQWPIMQWVLSNCSFYLILRKKRTLH